MEMPSTSIENAPPVESAIDYIPSEDLTPLSDPDTQIQVSSVLFSLIW